MIQTNEFQTVLSDELLNSLNDEVKTELLDAINNIQFIQNLISPTRKRAKDLPRDNQGRIIVDIVNPHILEDMDYFRPSAIHFQKYGKYTNLRPNRNPNSEYYKWITQEKDRCWNGMIRESDGEWIPGYYYFYLNYQPIIQTKVREGTNQGDRVTDFPLVWEGGYLAFHYLDQARNGGLYNDFKGGQHGVEIAKRGASKAHPLDAIVPTTQGFKKWGNVKIGDYLLTPDGETTKIIDEYKFYNSSIYKLLLENGSSVECSRSHLFETYYKGDKYLKSIDQIIELVTNLNNLEYSLAIPEPVYLKYQPVKVDPYIIGQLLCNPNIHKPKEFKEALSEINFKRNVFPQEYLFNSVFNRRNLLKGLLDSKGYVKEGIIRLDLNNKNVTLTVNKLIRSLGYNSSITQVDKIYTITIYTNNKLFSNENVNNKINCIDEEKIYFTKIIGIEFIGKKPAKCVTVDQPDGLYLIEDFIVTHNSYSLSSMMARNFILGENERSQKKVRSVITAFEKESLTKDATLNKFVEVIDFCSNNTEFPRQRLRDSISDMNWIMGYKDVQGRNKGTLNEVQGVSTNFNPDKARGKRANLFGYEEFGKFPKFIDTWNVNKPSIEEDDVVFGLGFAIGTGGTQGADFSGALEIIYNPIGYNVYALPNVFDKNSQGKQKTVFFFGAYLNRKGYYNENGVSDITGALISILNSRYKTKYNTSDPTTITRVKAENPITIQDAIMKIEGTVYPVADLNDRLNEIDLEPRSLDDIFTGTLNFLNNEVIYKPDYNAIPIREFPHKNNKLLGSIEIHKMPEKGSDGKVMRGRYIGGIDTYDDDESDTLSLGSVYILDLFTDKIVCEYTGRPNFADEFYELCRKILLFYDAEANYENNKKGLYKYFSQYNCLYLLSDNLDFLREREGPINTLRGNKAKGTLATGPIKNYYRTCIREWLTKPRKYIDDDGEEQVYTHLKELYSRALIKELILWNPDGNFDRHDALGMLMLLREEKLRVFGEDTPQDSVNFNDVDYLGNDEFFKANYRN